MTTKKRKISLECSVSGQFRKEWSAKYGVIEHNKKAFCCLCEQTVVARSYNINRHFETNHRNLCSVTDDERKEIIQRKIKQQEQKCSYFTRIFKPNNNISAASFQLSSTIAEHGKPLCDGDYLKEAFLNCSDFLFEDFQNKDGILKRINELPVARNTVKDRIIAMDKDVTDQLLLDLNNAGMFSICLDESTDVTQLARLAVIARFPSGNVMKEEIIKLMTLSEKTRGKDIMDELKKEFIELGIDFGNIVSVTTDGAPSMVGKNVGFVQLLKQEVNHNLVEFHCILHQQALCAKDSLNSLKNVMAIVTKIVNYITAHALNKRQFTKLLSEVDTQFSGLLMYNNVRWLSRGQVLNRFVELLEEIRLFLNEKGLDYPELTDVNWLNDLHFFADFTLHYNSLNKKLQGYGCVVSSMYGHIKAFEKKLDIFSRDLEERKMKYFPLLQKHFSTSNLFAGMDESALNKYSSIIKNAKDSFSERFSQFRELDATLHFIQFPHSIQFEDLKLSKFDWLDLINLEMELVDFQESAVWKVKFIDLNLKLQEMEVRAASVLNVTTERESLESSVENLILAEWKSLPNTFASMKKLALAILTMFGSSYSCEALFSSMNFIKSNSRNRLGTDMSAACVRLKTTKYKPRIKTLADKMQQQISH